jgi:hypothetical protein
MFDENENDVDENRVFVNLTSVTRESSLFALNWDVVANEQKRALYDTAAAQHVNRVNTEREKYSDKKILHLK